MGAGVSSSFPLRPPALVTQPLDQSKKDGRRNNAEAVSTAETETASQSKLNLPLNSVVDSKAAERDNAVRNQVLREVVSVSHSEDTSSLDHFYTLKQSPNVEDQYAAVRIIPQPQDAKLYLIGLLGSLNWASSNNDFGLQELIIGRLLSNTVSSQDLFLLSPILKSILSRLDSLSPESIQDIVSQVQSAGLLKSPDPKVRQVVAEFLSTIFVSSGNLSGKALPSRVLQGINQQVLASLSEESKSKLLALLMQAKVLTHVSEDRVIRDHWMMLYSAFMGIETSISLMEDELEPYMPDMVGLVVDGMTPLSTHWQAMKAIQVVPYTGAAYEDYEAAYRFLLKRYFKHIYALMPHSAYFRSYQTALEVAMLLPYPPKVIDTKTFGPAMGLLVDFIANILYHSGAKQLPEAMITQSLKRFRYWVIPQLSVVAGQDWFKKMPKLRPVRGNLHPVLAIYEDPFCVNALGAVPEAAMFVESLLVDALDRPESGYQWVLIEYLEYYQVAVDMKDFLKKKYPHLSIEVRHADPQTNVFWGQHISIGVI